MSDSADTIVATSTPAGRSPRAIVRLSGPEALEVASGVLDPKAPLGEVPAYGSTDAVLALAAEGIRCPAVVYVMRAPRSYTREDVVEVHTVGSPALLGALTDALVARGARPAEPGEFTRRAFLNGRIDLTQAEAVQAVIRARSEAELRVAQSQLGGAFRDAVEALRARTVQWLAELEAAIDFTDQDIELIEPAAAAERLDELAADVEAVAGSEPPAPPKEGVATAICGLPNAGKSSLLNALAGEGRAIVAHVPGTTRDTVEHPVAVEGITFRLVDTAGLRGGAGAIEREAVERAEGAAAAAELVLLVVDASRPLSSAARALWDRLTSEEMPPVITVLNKCDLAPRVSAADEGRLAQRGPVVNVSALGRDGLDALRAAMARAARSGAVDGSAHPFWVNARHRAALGRAAEALGRARKALADALGFEFAAADLRDALAALGDIVGRTTPDDVLGTIFTQFCIGK